MASQKPSKKAVTYCRVSSARQVREGHGLSSQDTRCREFAKHKGLEVVASFHDEGISGSLIERPQMLAMLEFLKAQDEQYVVIIDDISRLARGLEAHLQLRTTISEVGAKLESPSIEFGEDSDSLLVENLLASVSQHQRQKNAEQVKNRMRARVQNGYWISNPMVGYKYADIAGHGKLLVRHEPVASILQLGLELFACGQIETQTELKNYLLSNAAFPRNKQGTLHLQQVKDMLTRVLYAGYISLPTWGIHMQPAKHEPIISYETFDKIQKRLQAQSKAPIRKDLNDDFPLRGFVTCGCCDKPMTSCWSRSSNKSHYGYYLCRQKGCEMYGKSIRKEIIEEDFERLMQTITPSQEVFETASMMFKSLWDDVRSKYHMNSVTMEQEQLVIETKIAKLIERIVETDNPTLMVAYENSLRELEKKRILINEKISHLGSKPEKFDNRYRTAMNFLAKPNEAWALGDIVQKRATLKVAFTDKLSYTKNQGFRTPSMAEPLRVCNQLVTGSYEMVPTAGVELATY